VVFIGAHTQPGSGIWASAFGPTDKALATTTTTSFTLHLTWSTFPLSFLILTRISLCLPSISSTSSTFSISSTSHERAPPSLSIHIHCADCATFINSWIWVVSMGSRPVTPANDAYNANAPFLGRSRTSNSRPNSYLASGPLGGVASLDQGQGPRMDASPLSDSLNKHEDSYGLSYHEDGSIHDGQHNMTGGELRRSNSQLSQSQPLMPSKGGTLKKKASLRRTGSMKRSSSRRSSRAGSVRSLALGEKEKYGEGEEFNSAFYTPVPTAGSPTDILAARFQGS
jgi:hypothetical protein